MEIGGEQLHHDSDLEDLICILEGCVLEKWLIEHMDQCWKYHTRACVVCNSIPSIIRTNSTVQSEMTWTRNGTPLG